MWITAQWEHMNKVKAPKAKILLKKTSFEASLVVILIWMLGCHGEHRVWTNCWQAVRLRLPEKWSWTQVASELSKLDCLPHSRHPGKLPPLPGEKMKIDIWTNFHSFAAYLTLSSHHQVLLPECDEDDDEGVDEPDGARPFLGLRGGPCGDVTGAEASGSTSEDDNNPLSTSLEAKYFSQSFHQEDLDDGWNHCPDNLELEFQQGKFTELLVHASDLTHSGALCDTNSITCRFRYQWCGLSEWRWAVGDRPGILLLLWESTWWEHLREFGPVSNWGVCSFWYVPCLQLYCKLKLFHSSILVFPNHCKKYKLKPLFSLLRWCYGKDYEGSGGIWEGAPVHAGITILFFPFCPVNC